MVINSGKFESQEDEMEGKDKVTSPVNNLAAKAQRSSFPIDLNMKVTKQKPLSTVDFLSDL